MMRINPYRGIFIAVGGIDGSGKTTLASQRIVPYFQEQGIKTLLTQEPWFGGEASGRDFLLQDAIAGRLAPHIRPDAESLQEWFIENRKRTYAERLTPFLAEGKNRAVVSDRTYDGTLVYGRATVGPGAQERLLWKHEQMKEFFLPDLLVLLDIPVETAIARIERDTTRSGKSIFEKQELLEKIRAAYRSLPDFFRNYEVPQTVLFIDADRTQEQIFRDIVPALDALVSRKCSVSRLKGT